MKKYFIGLLILLLISVCSVSVFAEEELAFNSAVSVNATGALTGSGKSADFYYRIDPDGISIVSGTKNSSRTSLVLPDSIDGVPIVRIVDSAFDSAYINMTSLVLPSGLIEIGSDAFRGNDSLTNVSFGSSLKTIGDGAFGYCPLTSVSLSESLESIGAYAFSQTDLSSLVLPDSLTSIGAFAFSGTGIEVIHIPKTLTALDASLAGMPSLNTVTFSEGLTEIGALSFYGDTSLTALTLPESLTTIGRMAFYGSGIRELTLPIACVNLDDSAFQLESDQTMFLYLPEGSELEATLASQSGIRVVPADSCVKDGIVYRKTSEGVTILAADTDVDGIPDTIDGIAVTGIASYAFKKNTALTDVTLSNLSVGEGAFTGSSITSLTLHACTLDGAGIFENCTKLASVTGTCDTLPAKCFRNDTALSSFTLRANQIGQNCFENCTSLMILDLPEGYQTIKAQAFAYSALKTLYLPDSLERICSEALWATSLSEVYVSQNSETLEIEEKGLFTGASLVIRDSVTLPLRMYLGSAILSENAFGEKTVFAGLTETGFPGLFDSSRIYVREGSPAQSYLDAIGVETVVWDPVRYLGDIDRNGSINSSDALLVLRNSVREITLNEEESIRADTTQDGRINSSDALQILRYTVREITNFK